jgi:hypothetical protein
MAKSQGGSAGYSIATQFPHLRTKDRCYFFDKIQSQEKIISITSPTTLLQFLKAASADLTPPLDKCISPNSP